MELGLLAVLIFLLAMCAVAAVRYVPPTPSSRCSGPAVVEQCGSGGSCSVTVQLAPQVQPALVASHAQRVMLRSHAKVRARLARRLNQSYL